jgi:hypothetical protein
MENKNKRLQKDYDSLNAEMEDYLILKNKMKELEFINTLSNSRSEKDQEKHLQETEDLKLHYEKLLNEKENKETNKTNYLEKQIKELELLLKEQENEANNLKQNHDKILIETKKNYDFEMNKLKEQNKNSINEVEKNLQGQKNLNKTLNAEKDDIISKLLQANKMKIKLNEEIELIKLTNLKDIKILQDEIDEEKYLKKKLEENLQEEKLRYIRITNESNELRKIKNLLDQKIFELEDIVNNNKDLKDNYHNNYSEQITELKLQNSKNQNKINALENTLTEEKNKFISFKASYQKELNDLDEINEDHKRIIKDLKQKNESLENKKESLENLKISLEKNIEELEYKLSNGDLDNKNYKIEEQKKLQELQTQISNFGKIKDLLGNRIKELEENLDKEKSENIVYQKESQIKIDNLSQSLSEAKIKALSLEHQNLNFMNEMENEKKILTKKNTELSVLLKDTNTLKEKNLNDFIIEKSKMSEINYELEKKIKELNAALLNHTGKSDNSSTRVHELEIILGEERTRYEDYVLNSEKKDKEVSLKIMELLKIIENLQRNIIELEHELHDEKTKYDSSNDNREKFMKIFKEKENNLTNLIENMKKTKIEDDKNLMESNITIKDLNRVNKNQEIQIEELEQKLKTEIDKQITDCEIRGKLIKDLQAKFDLCMKEKNQIEKENVDLRAKYKALLYENENYGKKKNDLNERIKMLEDENSSLSKYKEDYYNLLQKNEILIKENNKNIADKDEDLRQMENINMQIKAQNEDLEKEIEELKKIIENLNYELDKMHQLNENGKKIYAEMEALRLRVKKLEEENLNLDEEIYKKNITIEEKEKIIFDLNEEINKINKKIDDILNDILNKQRSNLNEIDFKEIDYSQHNLLFNKNNWKICEVWLKNLGNNYNDNENLKLKLLYKASKHGYENKKFYEKCSGKKNTLIIAKNECDKLFGGFTFLEWKMPTALTHDYSADENKKTFLFSLDLEEKFDLKKERFKYAICNSMELGPVFGGGDFICLFK